MQDHPDSSLSTRHVFGVAAFTLFALPALAYAVFAGFSVVGCGSEGWSWAFMLLYGLSVIAPVEMGAAWAVGLAVLFVWHLHRLNRRRRFRVLLSDAVIAAIVLFFASLVLSAVLDDGMHCSLF